MRDAVAVFIAEGGGRDFLARASRDAETRFAGHRLTYRHPAFHKTTEVEPFAAVYVESRWALVIDDYAAHDVRVLTEAALEAGNDEREQREDEHGLQGHQEPDRSEALGAGAAQGEGADEQGGGSLITIAPQAPRRRGRR